MLVFLIHVFAFEKRGSRQHKWIVMGACIGLLGFYGGLRQLPAPLPKAAASSSTPAPMRALLMLRALGDYGRLMVFPSNLHVERTVALPRPRPDRPEWRQIWGRQYLSFLGLLVAAALLYGASRKGKAQPIRLFGAGWFILAYLPTSNLFELNATVAEHWLYLPSVGFLLFLTGCGLELPVRWRGPLAAGACAAVVGLGARSYVRSGDWLSPEIFYGHSLVAGAAPVRMALNLGQIYVARHDYARAEPLLRKVVEMSPNYPMGHNALGHLLVLEGKKDEAGKSFAIATKLVAATNSEQPRSWITAANIASMHFKEHDVNGALAVLEKARVDYPDTWPVIKLEAEALQAAQRSEDAIAMVRQFSETHWWHAPSALTLGRIYLEAHRLEEAGGAFRHASKLDVHEAEALALMAQVRLRQNRISDACELQRRAVARQPDQPRQYLLLCEMLQKMGRTEEAKATLAQVSRMQALVRANPALN